jgi:hypothetical protein
MRAALAIAALLVAAPAAADPDPVAPRPLHGSLGLGGATVFGGVDRFSAASAIDVLPGGRFGRWGVIGAFRDVGLRPVAGHGMLTLGVLREAAGARPRLVILLHADAGVAWGPTAPVVGGGVKTYLGVIGPLGLTFDVTAHLIVPSIDDTHVVVSVGMLGALLR